MEKSGEYIIEVTKTCRLCLSKNGDHDIFNDSHNLEQPPFLDMISSLFSFKIESDERLPSKICLKCKEKVSSYYDFKNTVENANKKLLCLVNESNKIDELINSINKYKETNTSCSESKEDKCETMDNIKIEFIDTESDDNHSTNQFSSDDFDEDDLKPLIFVKPDHPILPNNDAKGSALYIGNKKNSLSRKVGYGKMKYLCEFCPKEFTDKSSRRRHKKVQHLGILHFCDICKKYFRSKTSHDRYHRSDKTKSYKCIKCNKFFKSHNDLQNHLKTHAHVVDQSELVCNVCGKKFADKHLCASHKRRVHDKERPHQCTYCPKTFFSSHSLKDHITTHTKIRRYDCKECGMLFTTSTILKEHELRHTGNRDYGCSFCEKKFYRKKDLTRHELIHSKTYEHQCTYCGLKFRRKDHLSTHEKGVHNIIKNKINEN